LPLPRAPHARTNRAPCAATPRCRHAPRACPRHPPGKPGDHAPLLRPKPQPGAPRVRLPPKRHPQSGRQSPTANPSRPKSPSRAGSRTCPAAPVVTERRGLPAGQEKAVRRVSLTGLESPPDDRDRRDSTHRGVSDVRSTQRAPHRSGDRSVAAAETTRTKR
jgi:hypothetical protein